MTSSRARPVATSAASPRIAAVGDGRVVGRRERLERGAAALQVQGRDPVDEHDVGPGRALERTAVGLAAARPRQGGAVRVRRVGGGQEVDGRLARVGRPARATARSRSSAPASANCAAPRPSTK